VTSIVTIILTSIVHQCSKIWIIMVQKKYRQNILLVTEVINLVSEEIYQTPVTFIVLFIGGVDCNILTFF
jgi:hypothetical protein